MHLERGWGEIKWPDIVFKMLGDLKIQLDPQIFTISGSCQLMATPVQGSFRLCPIFYLVYGPS